MKVLQIISSGGMYGAEAVILNLSRALNGGPHRSMLGVFSNSSNPNLQLYNKAVAESIESHLIPCNGQIDRTTIDSIRALVTRTRADVVHAHGYKADVYVYLALRGQRTPFASTCHNWLNQNAMVSLYGMVDRYVLRKYSRVVAVSDEVRNRLLKSGVRKERVSLIRNGIDLRPFGAALTSRRARADATPVVGWIGRLSHEKGADIFLRAAARVLAQVPGVAFVVAGDGPERDKLESLIDELGIRRSVSMLGRRDDMPAVYALLDVMVVSSRQEGLPMAILEGMASALPLVATAVGQVPSVVLDGRTGLLVPPEDLDRLAANIVDLLRDPARRASLGAAGRQLVQDEYSAERMATDYIAVYEEAIATMRA